MKIFLLIALIFAAVLVTEGRIFGQKINFCRRNSQKVCQKYAKEDCDKHSLFGKKSSKKSHQRCVRMARRFCRKPVLPKKATNCHKLASKRCGRGKEASLCRTQHQRQCKKMAQCNKHDFALRRAKRRLARRGVHEVIRRPFRKRSLKPNTKKTKCKGLSPKRCLSLARLACGKSKKRRRCRRVFYSSCRRPITKKSCSHDAIKKCGTSRLRNRCRRVHKRHCRKINNNCGCLKKAHCRGRSRKTCKSLSHKICGRNQKCRNVFYSTCRKPKRVNVNKCKGEARSKCGKNRKCQSVHHKHCRKIARECKCRKGRPKKRTASCKGNSHKMCFSFAKSACGLGRRNLRCRRVFYGHCRDPIRVDAKKCPAQSARLCGPEKNQGKCRQIHLKHCKKVARECKCKKAKTNCQGKSQRVCRRLSMAACGSGRKYRKCRSVFYGNCRAPHKNSESCSGQARRLCGDHAVHSRCRSVHRKHCAVIQKQCKCTKKRCVGFPAKKCAILSRQVCGEGNHGKRCRRVFRRHCRSPVPVKDCVGQSYMECGGCKQCRRVHLEHCRKIRKNCKCKKIVKTTEERTTKPAETTTGERRTTTGERRTTTGERRTTTGERTTRPAEVTTTGERRTTPSSTTGERRTTPSSTTGERRTTPASTTGERRTTPASTTERRTTPTPKTLPPQPKCPRKCKRHSNCVSSDACHVGHCASDGVCRYRDTCGASKCNEAKCNDNNPCTLDTCTKKGCVHTDICNGHKCANGKLCDDGNLLTQDLCGKKNKCHHVPVCQGKQDGDKCFTYKAEVTGFWYEEKTGQSNPIAKCVRGRPKPGAKSLASCRKRGVKCYIDTDCKPQKDSGMVGHCDNSKCTFYKKCKNDSGCAAVKGNSPCITSKCHTKYGVCSWKAKCEDSNPCTLDRCTVTGANSHKCVHEQVKCSVGECPSLTRTVKQSLAIESAKCDPKKGCGFCVLDSACDDGIACTLDKCVGSKCVHTPISGKNIDPWLNLWCDPNVNGFKVRDQADPRVVAASRAPNERT